jgi:glycosyltransferase involved in cell wall biosynthesis
MDREYTERQLQEIIKQYPERKCKVNLLHGDLSAGQMTWLYNHPKIAALANIAHGEGYGLPLFEAAREGLPVATIGWSGQLDFLHHDGKDYFEKVEFTLGQVQQEAVWDGVVQADSMWAYADENSYKQALRSLITNNESARTRASELKQIIENNFSDERLYELFVSKIIQEDNFETVDVGLMFEE